MNLAQRLTAQKNARKNPTRTRAKTSGPVSPTSNLPTKIVRDIPKISAAINSAEESHTMTTQAKHTPAPLERLRHHVSGAISRGESVPVVEVSAPATHTPGPWETKRAATPEAFPQFGVYAENGNGHDLAHVVSHGTARHAETEANARLIAAAPDLLEALQKLTDVLADVYSSEAQAKRALCSASKAARTAIAKAEGRAE